jgi:hypothetical protein
MWGASWFVLFMKCYKVDQIKEDEMRGTCIMNGGNEKCVTDLVGKPEGKRPLRRHKYMWEIILKWIIRKLGLGIWIGFIWPRIGTSGRLL